MTRMNAALLAGVGTALLFAAAFSLIDWLVGTAGFWRGFFSPLFVAGVIVFNSVVVLPVIIWRQRRAKREEKDERATPLPASERLKVRRGV